MKFLRPICVILVVTVSIAVVYLLSGPEAAPPLENPAADSAANVPASVETGEAAKAAPGEVAKAEPGEPEKLAPGAAPKAEPGELARAEPGEPAKAETESPPVEDAAAEPAPTRPDLSYLADYAYSEVPPDIKPADTVEESLKDVPVGTPVEEIKLASEALGLDVTFMKTVAKIESDFDPKQKTGSYIGLFQLSHYEFDKYGSGDITNPRDNAIAAAYKFATAAILFEIESHKKATRDDLYLIHQQGTQGAAEHVSHPERIAWKSMCATDEGHEKGEKWCKRAIWQNTLPAIKQIWKSVDNLPSGAFVAMWQQRIAMFYSRYSEALTAK